MRYYHDSATLATRTKHSTVIKFTGTVGPNGHASGGEAAFDASSEKFTKYNASERFTKYNAGVGVTKPEFQAAFILKVHALL